MELLGKQLPRERLPSVAGQENGCEGTMATTALAKPSSSITVIAGREELWGVFNKN